MAKIRRRSFPDISVRKTPGQIIVVDIPERFESLYDMANDPRYGRRGNARGKDTRGSQGQSNRGGKPAEGWRPKP